MIDAQIGVTYIHDQYLQGASIGFRLLLQRSTHLPVLTLRPTLDRVKFRVRVIISYLSSLNMHTRSKNRSSGAKIIRTVQQ